jgi:hypothetical protein
LVRLAARFTEKLEKEKEEENVYIDETKTIVIIQSDSVALLFH